MGRQMASRNLARIRQGILNAEPALVSVLSDANPPLKLLALLHFEIQEAPLHPALGYDARERTDMHSHINRLSENVARCETLLQTPVPRNYFRHTSRFLSTFLLSLPFVLVSQFGMLTHFVVAFSAWALFGIQEIGLRVEEPFRHVLPLDVICQTICSDVIEATALLPSEKGLGIRQSIGQAGIARSPTAIRPRELVSEIQKHGKGEAKCPATTVYRIPPGRM